MRSEFPKRAAFTLSLARLLLFCRAAVAEPGPIPEPLPPVEEVFPDLSTGTALPAQGAPGSELTERGRGVRGVYVPYPKLSAWSPEQLASWALRIGADAVILDIKDDLGRVTFADDLPLAAGSPHGGVRQMKEILSVLRQNGIYAIGRLVCFKDNNLARIRPAEALRHRRTGAVWRDRGRLAWVDPHSRVVHGHIVSVARAAQAIGFDEIQLDYVRFPVEPAAGMAVFPRREAALERHEVIASLLSRVDRAISIPLSIDVFGLTAYNPGDADGLGQSLEHLAPYIDAISPMVYLANWPRRYWESPSQFTTHALVRNAVRHLRRRLGDEIAVRPLLQAFAWRVKGFGTSFIHNQIDAAVVGGSSGYLFWNQRGNYDRVQEAFSQLDRKDVRSIPVVSQR